MAKEEILEMAEVSRTNKFKQSAKLVSIVISSFPSRSNIKTRAQIFSEADLDGLHDFIDAESTCLRTFWASVLVLATICASYMSWLFISNALEQPTVSKMEFVVPKDLRYPTVTVCDHRGSRLLNKTKLQLDGISDNSVQLMLLSGPIWLLAYDDFPNISIFDDSVATGFLLAYQQEFGNPAEMLRKFFLTYGAPCDSLFHSCRDANWDRLDCCQMFFPIIHARHGLCYASDPEKMPKISAPGLFSNFFLKFRKPENLWSIRGAAKNNSEEAVFTLDISIDTGIDQGVWRADYLTVEFGFWSTVNLGFKHIKAEPSAAIACEQDPQLSYFQHYTFSNCMWERRLFKHEQFQLTKDCQLPITRVLKLGNKVFNHERYPDLKELNNEPMCDPLEIFNYIYKPFNESFAGGTFSGISYWIKRLQMSSENTCRLPCEHWDFDFSEDKYREFPDDLNAGVTLTVRDVQYPYIREVPALEWVDYLALIGGAWGLCVGASFITVIQLVVYTIRFLFRSKQADKQIDAN